MEKADTGTLIWAMSLACGVAGALGWDAPVLAYYWPLGLGGAGLALAIPAYLTGSKVPWFAAVAIIASVVAVVVGLNGHSDIEHVRNQLPY